MGGLSPVSAIMHAYLAAMRHYGGAWWFFHGGCLEDIMVQTLEFLGRHGPYNGDMSGLSLVSAIVHAYLPAMRHNGG